MIPVLINGFAPSTVQETIVQLYDPTFSGPKLAILAEGTPDETGLVRLEIDDAFAGTTILLRSMAPSQKLLSHNFILGRDGVFVTVRSEPDHAYIGDASWSIPRDWQTTSTAEMEQLRREVTFPALTLRRAREDSRVRYFQHFTSLWSAFNSWYNQTLDAPMLDRKCIDALKAGSGKAGEKVHAAIAALAVSSQPAKQLPDRDFGYEGYRQYLMPTPFTHFVQMAYENQVTRQGFYVGIKSQQLAKTGLFAKKCVPIAHLSNDSYYRLYRALRVAQASSAGILENDKISVQAALG